MLTKEKIDGQLSGKSSSTLFMRIKDITIEGLHLIQGDKLGDKIGKLTIMIGKLAARDSRSGR